MSNITIKTPLFSEDIEKLNIKQKVNISGSIYIARDAAHKRMIDTISKGEILPFDIENQIIYYAGPCPEKPGSVIGSCGPTTSSRMDKYTPLLLSMGLKGMIGKGNRCKKVINSIKENKAVYFSAIGGTGALLSKKIIKQEIVAYEDLGTEALRKVVVKDFPVIVTIK